MRLRPLRMQSMLTVLTAVVLQQAYARAVIDLATRNQWVLDSRR